MSEQARALYGRAAIVFDVAMAAHTDPTAAARLVLRDGLTADGQAALLSAIESIPGSTAWSKQRVDELIAGGRDRSVVASVSDEVVGVAFAYLWRDLNTFLFPGPAVLLRRLIVLAEHRSRGVGQALLEAVLQHAVGTPVAWQTNVANRSAVAWFARRGIVPVGSINRGEHHDLIYWIDPDDNVGGVS